MRILQANKFYRIVGGSERYMFNLIDLLQAKGHEIIPFSMAHPDNEPTPYAKYFVSGIDYYPTSLPAKLGAALRGIPRMIWSREAARRMQALLREVKPDVAHLHMIDHQISPSILPVLHEAGVPVVLSAHQYKLVCANYRLLNERTHEICELCLDGRYHHPPLVRCHRGSLASSLALAVEMSLHKRWRVYERNVDIVHVPSRFMGGKLAEGGIDAAKIRHADLTLDLSKYDFAPGGEGLVYFGRLSAEKGVGAVLQAAARYPDVPFTIIGGGPYETALHQQAADLNVRNVTFTGPLYGDELIERIRAGAAVLLPSEWYENSPLVIYESFSLGRPVIGARIGGITEYIQDGKTGFLFDAGDVDSLCHAIDAFRAQTDALPEMQRIARQTAEARFAPETHYTNIMAIYEAAQAARRAT